VTRLADRAGIAPELWLAVGAVTTSGRDIDTAAERLAAALSRHGVARRQRVAVIHGNTLAFAVSVLAILKLEASAVLISPQSSAREVGEALRRAHASWALAAPSAAGKLTDYATRMEPSAIAGADGSASTLWRTPHAQIAAGPDEMMVQFTSGAAGRPKAVARSLTHLEHELEAFASALSLGRTDPTVCPCPLSHSYGLLNGFLMPLFMGRPSVLLDGLLLPGEVVRAVAHYKARVLVGVPAIYRAMAETYGATADDLSSVQYCFTAARR